MKMNCLQGITICVSTAVKVENVRLDDILTRHADRLRELEGDDPPLEPRPAFTFIEGGSSGVCPFFSSMPFHRHGSVPVKIHSIAAPLLLLVYSSHHIVAAIGAAFALAGS